MMQNHRKQTWISRIAACCAALLLGLGGAVRYYAEQMPDHFYADRQGEISVSAALPLTLSTDTAKLRLFGIVPVKTVSLTEVAPQKVYIGGEPFGIRMLMAGAMVVSLSDVGTPKGVTCPAKAAGIEVGDVIQSVGSTRITDNAALQQAVSESGGSPVTVTLTRGGTQLTLGVQPVWSVTAKRWQIGMWVRDSTAGIGTITCYTLSPTGAVQFAGLGHAVCDADTGERIPLASGDVIPVRVTDVRAGMAGRPGELHGAFDTAHSIGTLLSNTERGIFGSMDRLPAESTEVPIGYRQDVHRGEAYIYTTLSGTSPQVFTVEIEEIRRRDDAMQDIIIHVTDRTLLEQTGGIVQGMSGSPILQDGRLIGAVTHVFVKDPTRGYGIFAENMLGGEI